MVERTRVLVRLSAAVVAGESALPAAMDAAAAVAADEAEEVLLQSFLFLGIPTALNALGLWRRRTGHRPTPRSEEPPEGWAERGRAICRAVYGSQYEALRELMAVVHPELDEFAVADGYGKILGREELDLQTRELCIVTLLAGTRATRQLHAHLRGCLNVGAPPDLVGGALEAVRDLLPPERMEEAMRVWERVRMRWQARTGE